jgi:hypothetical protein
MTRLDNPMKTASSSEAGLELLGSMFLANDVKYFWEREEGSRDRRLMNAGVILICGLTILYGLADACWAWSKQADTL